MARRFSLTSALYSVARSAAWGRAIGKAAAGNPLPILRRVRNRAILGQVGRLLRF